MFYAMCDEILFNPKDKNNGDNFDDFKSNVHQIGLALEDLKYVK